MADLAARFEHRTSGYKVHVDVEASPLPPGSLVYVGAGQMEPLGEGELAAGQRCLALITARDAEALLACSPAATGRPVILFDPTGIVAGAQAARFMVLTDTVPHGVLRRVDQDEGWAISTAEARQAFEDETRPQGPDIPAIIMNTDGHVVHGADVLSGVRAPTWLVVIID